MTVTVTSTMDSREWWRDEAIRTRTDWKSLLRQHQDALDRLSERVSSS